MTVPFEALKPEYSALLTQMRITRLAEVTSTAERLVGFIDAGRYDAGCKATGVAVPWAAASFEREASSNFHLNPAQGWPLASRSQWIPHNGPFADWTTAQIAAYDIDGLDKVGAANWTWERACYEGEIFNGMGYRAHGVHSPYLWAGSNIYSSGKYVADGVWSAAAIDQQLGIIPMMVRIVQMRPALALVNPLPAIAPTVPPPQPPPEGLRDATALQTALNNLGADPKLVVDGNYGRNTKRAVIAFQAKAGLPQDGIAGPDTWAAIDAALPHA